MTTLDELLSAHRAMIIADVRAANHRTPRDHQRANETQEDYRLLRVAYDQEQAERDRVIREASHDIRGVRRAQQHTQHGAMTKRPRGRHPDWVFRV